MGLPFFFLINLLLNAISIYLLGKGESWGHPKPRQGRPPGPPFPTCSIYPLGKGESWGHPNPARGGPWTPLSPPGLLMLHYERRSDLREAADSMKRDSLS